MSNVVASLIAEIGADVTGFDNGLNHIDNKLSGTVQSIQSRMQNMGAFFTGAGLAATAFTAPLAVGMADGINAASDFQDTLTEISARTGVVGTDLQRISDYALQMGADTVFSGQEAADAFLQLLTSGSSVEEAFAILPSVLDGAAASGADLGQTADLLTDIMASFGVDSEYAVDVIDDLARAAGSSSADMTSLGQGFANVGNVASNMGMSVNDTAAVLAIFSENGIKGAEAGTALKSMLLNMQRSTEDTQAAWDELGTSLYDAEGNARPLNTVISELDTALDQLPVEEQNRLMMDLAGSYGIMGLAALRGEISIEEMQEAMRNAASASDVAEARMDTFSGAVNSLKGSVETLQITALTPLLENTLKPLAVGVTGVVNSITAWLTENPRLTAVLSDMTLAAVSAGPAIAALGGALLILSSPIALAGLAFAGVAAGIAGIASAARQGFTLDDITDPLINLGNNIKTAFDNLEIGEKISGFVDGIKTTITTAINNLGFNSEDFSDISTEIGDALSIAISDFDSATGIDLTGVETWMTDNSNAILDSIVSVAGIVFGGPIGITIGIANLVKSAIENDFLGIGTFLEESGIASSVESAFNDLKTTIDSIIDSIFGGGAEATDTPLVAMTGTFEDFGAGVDTSALTLFATDISTAISAIVSVGSTIGQDIIDGLKDLGDGVAGFIDGITGAETEGLYDAIRPVLGTIGGIAIAGLQIAGSGVSAILSALGAALPGIGAAIGDFITMISRAGEGDFGGAIQALVSGVGNLAGAFIDLTSSLADFTLEKIEELTGLELPSVDEGMAAWVDNFERLPQVLSVVLDQIGRDWELFLLDIEMRMGIFLDDINNKTRGTVVETNFNVNPTMSMDRIGALEINDELQSVLASQLTGGAIDLDAPINFTASSGVSFAGDLGFLLDVALNEENISEQMKNTLVSAAKIAIETGDFSSAGSIIDALLDVDVDPAKVAQLQSDLETAITSSGTGPAVDSDVSVTPNVSNLVDVVSDVETTISSEAYNPIIDATTEALAEIANITDFVQNIIDTIQAQDYSTSVDVPITVNPVWTLGIDFNNPPVPKSVTVPTGTGTGGNSGTPPVNGNGQGGAPPPPVNGSGQSGNAPPPVVNINVQGTMMGEDDLYDAVNKAAKKAGLK